MVLTSTKVSGISDHVLRFCPEFSYDIFHAGSFVLGLGSYVLILVLQFFRFFMSVILVINITVIIIHTVISLFKRAHRDNFRIALYRALFCSCWTEFDR